MATKASQGMAVPAAMPDTQRCDKRRRRSGSVVRMDGPFGRMGRAHQAGRTRPASERPERRHLWRSARSLGRPDAPAARRPAPPRRSAAAVQPAQQASDVGRKRGESVRRSDSAALDSGHRRAVGFAEAVARRRRARGVPGVHRTHAVREHRNRDHHVLAGPDVLRLLRGEAVPCDRDVRLRAADRGVAQARVVERRRSRSGEPRTRESHDSRKPRRLDRIGGVSVSGARHAT